MSDKMTISVVIPAYNAALYLRRSIESVLAQTFKPLEIVVVDDGSTDDTATVAESYANAIRYIFQKNSGCSVARNTGIEVAKGNWIAFLDVDDAWKPHHLKNAVQVLQNHPELKWYGAPVDQYIDVTNELLQAYRKPKKDILVQGEYFADYMIAFPPYAHFSSPTMVIHRSVFEDVGYFESQKWTGQDRDMWFRIALHFPTIGYSHCVGADVYKRQTSNSYTKPWDSKGQLEELIKWENLAASEGVSALLRAERRLIYWSSRLLRATIINQDKDGVEAILSHYGNRLPWYYRQISLAFLALPSGFKLANRLRNYISTKQKIKESSGLTRHL